MTTPSHDRGMSREQIETMAAGPEMDAAVAERVMGWVWCDSSQEGLPNGTWDDANGETRQVGDWSPSTDIAAAWEVVEKMYEKRWSFRLTWNCAWPKDEPAIQKILDPTGLCTGLVNASFGARQYGLVEHTTTDAPLAICRAALLTTLTGAAP